MAHRSTPADRISEHAAVGLVGASGRLGTAIAQALADAGTPVVPGFGRSDDWSAAPVPGVLIDAATADACARTADYCRAHGIRLISCASALDEESVELIALAAREIPVVRATNLSLGHWLQRRAMAEIARARAAFPENAGSAVAERHPVTKRDRPSASALGLAGHWNRLTGQQAGVDARRGGLAVSEHLFELTLGRETLTLHHDVRDLGAPARGAVLAAGWIRRAAPGLWSMDDVYEDFIARERA